MSVQEQRDGKDRNDYAMARVESVLIVLCLLVIVALGYCFLD